MMRMITCEIGKVLDADVFGKGRKRRSRFLWIVKDELCRLDIGSCNRCGGLFVLAQETAANANDAAGAVGVFPSKIGGDFSEAAILKPEIGVRIGSGERVGLALLHRDAQQGPGKTLKSTSLSGSRPSFFKRIEKKCFSGAFMSETAIVLPLRPFRLPTPADAGARRRSSRRGRRRRSSHRNLVRAASTSAAPFRSRHLPCRSQASRAIDRSTRNN